MGFFGQDKSVPLSSAYKVGTQYPLDVRQTVESEEDLWSLSVWGSYKSLKKEWGFSMYPNMLVGIANTNIVYQLNGSVPQITDKDAVRFPEGTWHKIATQEWVAEQGFGKGAEIPENTYDAYGSAAAAEENAKAYADEKVGALYTKDAVDGLIQEAKDYADANDTKYGIEYNSVTKTIKLVEGGTETEIDASDFIKDGMLSSVVADQDNNKLTFYWNTTAGIETTEIALASIADIYTGVEGNRIEVTVGTDNTINADLIENSISKDYLDESIKASLALADSAVQDSDLANFASTDSVTTVSNDLATYKTSNNTALAQVKTTADAAAVKTEVEAGFSNVDKKFENYKTAEAQKAIDDEQDRKLNIIAADIANFETKENVKKVSDDLAAYIKSNDSALAGVKTTAEAARTEDEVDGQIDAKIAVLNLADTYEPIGAETRAKGYVDSKLEEANLAQYTTEQEVKDIVDAVVTGAVDGDTITGLANLVDYINTHGGEAAEMASAIDVLEGQVKVIEETPAYDITPTQISNWDSEVGAKQLAESKTTTAEVQNQIEAQGYAKIADLGDLASKDNLSASDVGAYNTSEVDAKLAEKQGNLSEAQLAAVNSGINTTKVGAYDGIVNSIGEYAKTADIEGDLANGTTAYGWGDHAQAGYAKADDLGSLASRDGLSATEVGAYTKEEVDSLISSIDTSNLVALDGDQVISGKKSFENLALTISVQEVSWSEDLITNQVDLSGATLVFSNNAPTVIDIAYFNTSGGYRLVSSMAGSIDLLDADGMLYARIYNNGWQGDSFILPNDFGFITTFRADNAIELLSERFPAILIPESPVEKIVFNENKYIAMPDESGTVATQEWVEAQGYGQGSGSIDTTKFVTLDGEQTIIGNKTFTGDVDFSNATVKGLAIDPADVDLAGYATEDWVNSQGYVTASYLDNILTFSTSGSEASAVNYSNDEVLFTEDLYVTNPMGDFVSGDNVKGLSLQEIITRLLKLETNI